MEGLADCFSLAAKMKLASRPGAGRGSEGRVIELHARQSDLSEKMQVRRHYDPGAKMDGRRERYFAGQIVCHQPNRQLALTMRLLINGSGHGSFLKVRRHFREKIRRNQLGSSGNTPRAQSPAHGKAIDGVHIESGKIRNLTQQIESLLKTFVFVFVPLDNANDLASGTVAGETRRKSPRFSAGDLRRSTCQQ